MYDVGLIRYCFSERKRASIGIEHINSVTVNTFAVSRQENFLAASSACQNSRWLLKRTAISMRFPAANVYCKEIISSTRSSASAGRTFCTDQCHDAYDKVSLMRFAIISLQLAATYILASSPRRSSSILFQGEHTENFWGLFYLYMKFEYALLFCRRQLLLQPRQHRWSYDSSP